MLKKLVSLLLVAVLLSISSFSFAFANTSTSNDDKKDNKIINDKDDLKTLTDEELTKIINDYKLTKVNSVPSGITPREFNNLDELKNYLKEFPKGPVKIKKQYSYKDFLTSESSNKIILDATESTESRHHIIQEYDVTPVTYIFLEADVYTQVVSLGGTHLAEEITDCHEWTDMNGFTTGYSWNQTYAYHRISSDRYNVEIYGGGVLDQYIKIGGEEYKQSVPIDIEASYTGGVIN
ncbi:hypothetical protein [Thermoanaerobacterium sp. RBIITD]|nr:hypothetical protein [Thermoanaerobacterium sp. RBIITD]SNX53246.1 hypothetical protein SAMN05660242_0757 [Thermoanaerobacterium sp. RBIITD]